VRIDDTSSESLPNRFTVVEGSATALHSNLKSQKAFEKLLNDKTAKQNGDITILDNHLVLYKTEANVTIFVVGDAEENEILLSNVIVALRDSLQMILKLVLST
jgi:hypothetical protein